MNVLDKNMFSEKVQEYLTNQMNICIDDLTKKIMTDTHNNSNFFNDLFEYMIGLKLPHEYDLNLNNSNNAENSKFLNKKLCDFFKNSGFNEESPEYLIHDNMRHAFINFKQGGVLQMYQYREPDMWYPKIIINKFFGAKNDIDELESKIIIYRGTSKDEFYSKKLGQSWTLDENIAREFAFIHYNSQVAFQNTRRVLLSTVIDKKSIFYYEKYGRESEVIIDTAQLNHDLIKIIEDKTLREIRCQATN